MRYTTISWRLQPNEVEYIVKDCDAKILITSKFLEETANDLNPVLDNVHKFMLDGTTDGYQSYENSIEQMSTDSIEDECQGGSMLYSSGTTGKPKGIMLTHGNIGFNALALKEAWNFTQEDCLLHALPIYHVHGLFVALGCVFPRHSPTSHLKF